MKIMWILLLMFVVGCQRTVLKQDIIYGFMPDSMHIMDSLLTTVSEAPDLKDYDDFKSVDINGGTGNVCVDDECDSVTQISLQRGILVSDRTAYELAYNRIAITDVNRRLVIANELFTEYYKQIKIAENLYDKRIQYLEKACERSWFEQNSIYFGFLAGIITTVAIQYAVIEVAK